MYEAKLKEAIPTVKTNKIQYVICTYCPISLRFPSAYLWG